jgi:lambda repressor-like predicted transcriptional regulator
MPDVSAAISDLQSRWHNLADLDRARAVYAIQRAGTSLRALAKALNCSPSLLRHLLTALQAPREDRSLAQQGEISTNELVRRTRAAGLRRAAKNHEALELQRILDAREACRKICEWLVAEGIPGSYGEQVVAEARGKLAVAELRKKLPKGAAPPDMPVADIIQRSRPAGPVPDNAEFTSWAARWLFLWAYYAMPDSNIRLQAIDLALDLQGRRW